MKTLSSSDFLINSAYLGYLVLGMTTLSGSHFFRELPGLT